MTEKLYHDDNTMNKVYACLLRNGHTPDQVTDVISDFQNAGIVFRERHGEEDHPAATETTEGPVHAEWIERQEEERRAWAINSTVELLRHADSWTSESVVPLAKEIEAYVKGPEKEDPDLHDQDAFDTWGVVMYEQLFGERIEVVTEEDIKREASRHEMLDKLSDALTKNGVRFKNGERFDRLVDQQP